MNIHAPSTSAEKAEILAVPIIAVNDVNPCQKIEFKDTE